VTHEITGQDGYRLELTVKADGALLTIVQPGGWCIEAPRSSHALQQLEAACRAGEAP
jgi:hypothetical protein